MSAPKNTALATYESTYEQIVALQAEVHKLEKIKKVITEESAQEALSQMIEKKLADICRLSTTKQNTALEVADMLKELDADWSVIEHAKQQQIKYIIDSMIVKNEITMIAAKPASGKSVSAMGVCAAYLRDESDARVVYFDFDNSISTLAHRNIEALKSEFGERFVLAHGSKHSLDDVLIKLKKMALCDLSDYLFVFDSIKNFIKGDRDKNKDVSELLGLLKSIRDAGATVLYLHHTNKPQKDFSSDFAGAAAFAEDVANAFALELNRDTQSLLFRVFKARTGELKEQAFKYDFEGHKLISTNFTLASKTAKEREAIEELCEQLKNKPEGLNFQQTYDFLRSSGLMKNREAINKFMKKFENIYWIKEKVNKKNQSMYKLKLNEN